MAGGGGPNFGVRSVTIMPPIDERRKSFFRTLSADNFTATSEALRSTVSCCDRMVMETRGGFNWSSQHLTYEVVDDKDRQAEIESFDAKQTEVTGPPAGVGEGRATAVLGSDCAWADKCRRRAGGRRVPTRRHALVSPLWGGCPLHI